MDRLLEATYRAERRHFWFHGFRRFVRPLVERALRGLAAPRILDCACGTGANLEWLGRYGAAFGFDLTWSGLALGRREGPCRVARANVTAVPFATESVDLATSFDVLYCLHDPEEARALAEMHRVVTPGGAIIINVAALPALRGDHSILGGEVRRYTRGELRRSIERAGFRIERLTYTNFSILPVVAGVRLMQRLRPPPPIERAGREISVPPAPINALLTSALALESYALRVVDMPLGSSLLCLARKPRRR